MAFLYFTLGIVSILLGLAATLTIKSDIQVIIVIVLVVAGLIMIGIADLCRKLERLMK